MFDTFTECGDYIVYGVCKSKSVWLGSQKRNDEPHMMCNILYERINQIMSRDIPARAVRTQRFLPLGRKRRHAYTGRRTQTT